LGQTGRVFALLITTMQKRARRASETAAFSAAAPPASSSTSSSSSLSSSPFGDVEVARGVPFGAHGLTLDVYTPAAARLAPLPLVVYVHGGGWKVRVLQRPLGLGLGAGDVGGSLARRGFVVASVQYRLSAPTRAILLPLQLWWGFVLGAIISAAASRGAAPPPALVAAATFGCFALLAIAGELRRWRGGAAGAARWPAHAEDAAAAAALVVAQAARFGADARRVAVLGHSAGAHVALMLALEPRFLRVAGAAAGLGAGALGAALRAAVGCSGVYCAELLEGRGVGPLGARAWFARQWYLRAAFGNDAAAWRAAFPVGAAEAAAAGASGAGGGGAAGGAAGGAGADAADGESAAAAAPRPALLLTNAAPGRDWGLHEHTERLLPLLARAGFCDVERLVLERTGHITSILGVGVAGSEGEEVLVPRVAAFLRERMTAS